MIVYFIELLFYIIIIIKKMLSKGLTCTTFLTTIIIIIVAIYYRQNEDDLRPRLLAVLQGLEKLENKHEIKVRPKVAIGYGACADVYINAQNLLHYSALNGQPQHFDEINNYEELLKSFAYYFRHGAAAE